jgi:GDP-4-dehydro-6-deoxy-D-mannose reductase
VNVAGESVSAPLVEGLPSWDAPGLSYRTIDVRARDDLAALLDDVRPSLVFHLASGLRDDPPSHLFPTNVEGTIVLLEAIADAGIDVERIVLGSSGSVYGEAARSALPLGEAVRCEPADLYAVSKLAAEHAARAISRVRGLPVVAARIFNVIGAGQEERHVVGRFASQIAAIASGNAAPRLAIGDLTPTRDFIDVRDVAAALVRLGEHGIEPAYNVGSGIETSIATILNELMDLAGVTGRVEVVAAYARPADLPRYAGDIDKLERLGYAPAFTLRESLSAVLQYYTRLVEAG